MHGSSYRAVIRAVVASACVLSAGCGPDLPPSLPSTDAHLRMAARVDLVDLVISDPVRAAKVRRLYAEIEALMIEVKTTMSTEIVKLGYDKQTRTDAETRAVIDRGRDAEVAAFRRYVHIQLELRRCMNAEEFAKLDAIK